MTVEPTREFIAGANRISDGMYEKTIYPGLAGQGAVV